MTSRYPLIAAAVASALASSLVAAQPALTSAASPTVSLNIAGASAVQTGMANAIANDVCGGTSNVLTIRSGTFSGEPQPDKNFYAYSCYTAQDIPAQGGGTDVPSGTLVTIYYRSEGGSVDGALPIAANHQINRLNLSDPSCAITTNANTASCSITGVTSSNGPSDSWGPATVEDYVQLGVTDVEPAQLTGHDSPLALPYGNAPANVAYKTSAFGSATATQIAGLNVVRLYDEVYGLAINTSGESFSTVNLSKQEAAAILNGNLTDWSKVTDWVTGNPVSSVSAPITVVNREFGSGSRTVANIYFEGYCYGGGSTYIASSSNLYYSTSDVLSAANTTGGAITYTAIDQIQEPSNSTNYTNLVLATLQGVVPSNLAAALGTYDFWFEAELIPASGLSGQTLSLATFLETDLPALSKAPDDPSIDVIPGYDGNTAAYPTPPNNGQTGTKEIYVNQYTRNGASCQAPVNDY